LKADGSERVGNPVHVDPPFTDRDTDEVDPSRSSGGAETRHLLALSVVDGIDRVAAPDPGPDLDDHTGAAVESDQIELAPAHHEVAGQDAKTATRQEPGGDRLSERPYVGA
jgi:hypothetical protein